MAVAILTDIEQKRSLTVVCDNMAKGQLGIRISGSERNSTLLPEVMLDMLSDCTDVHRYEIIIHDIVEGEYKTMIVNLDTLHSYPIRLSDAIILSRISNIKIFINTWLMHKQSSPYCGDSNRMAIPINVLSTEKLEEELDKAVEEENYRLASQIKKELSRRK